MAAPVREELTRLKAAGVAGKDLRRMLLPLEREFRSKANTDGGYAIVDLTIRWIDRIDQQSVRVSAGDRVLLMTDGFYRLIDTSATYTADTLMAAAVRHGLQPLYEELRALEAADEDCAAFPRDKVRDDVTAALLAIDG